MFLTGIQMLLKWCNVCKKMVNAKKEKNGKGQDASWYCPHCGTNL